MLRLFVSLYLLLIISISAINTLSEKLWQSLNNAPSSQLIAIEQVASSLALTLNSQNVRLLSKRLELAITPQDSNDVALLSWQEQALMQREAVITIDEHDEIYAYVQPESQLYLIGPFYQETQSNIVKPLIFLISYLCLAGIIALWVWPLWRDLKSLQRASDHFSQGGQALPIPVNKRSTIAPVLTTFNTMTAQISRHIDEQRQLTNAVSHEIRTPLSRLKFTFAMLDKEHVPQLPCMRQDVVELERLVDEMLNYGRLESQNDNLHIEDVNISELATHLIDKLTRHHQVNVTRNITENIICRCDGHLIERALQNYITNALRYAQSQVTVTITQTTNRVIFHVEDDGHGIKESQRDLVFQAFTRLDKSRNKDNGGFGLGLAIVKRIAQWHKGECSVDSSALNGAKFSLIIPKHLL